MTSGKTNIIIADSSSIIYEGLASIISKAGSQFFVTKVDELCDIEQVHAQNAVDVIIINPSLVQNQVRTFNHLKRDMAGTQWIGLVYSLFDQQLMSMFDAIITINDAPGHVIDLIRTLLTAQQPEESQQAETLSERETEVLKLLVSGNSNKEIADKLFISTHTVITHRKNISQKTGIKSVSGLTIYAVVNNIVKLGSFSG